MLKAKYLFIKRILTPGNFLSSQVPKSNMKKLLTELANLKNQDVIVIPEFIMKFAKSDWTLIVDEILMVSMV